MNILTINTWYSYGGAARIAKGLHDYYNKTGLVNSTFISMEQGKFNSTHIPIHKNRFEFKFSRLLNRIDMILATQYWWEPFSKRILMLPEYKAADVIHCHNLHCFFFNPNLLLKFREDGKKIVFTLHDEWWITGHCAFHGECNLHKSECYKCNKLNEYPSIIFDRARKLYQKKKKLIEDVKPIITAPAKLLLNQASESEVLIDCQQKYIPNFYDPDFSNLYLDEFQKEQTLFFCANNLFEERKGLLKLIEAVKKYNDDSNSNYKIKLAGSGRKEQLDKLNANYEYLGYLESKAELAKELSASDALILPSDAEVAPIVILEALACGIPVIAFDSGGVSELINDDCGILIKNKTVDGIINALNKFQHRDFDSKMINDKSKQYSLECVAKEYVEIYRNILDGKGL